MCSWPLLYLDVEFLDGRRGDIQRCFQLGDQSLKIPQFDSDNLELQFDVFVRSALQNLQSSGQVSELAQKNHQLTFDTGDLRTWNKNLNYSPSSTNEVQIHIDQLLENTLKYY